MDEVMLKTSIRANQLFNFSKTVYIDGHFMPYYGETEILNGYFSQRRLAMKGREYFFVHDEYANPVFCAISDGYQKMKFYIEKIDRDLRKIYGVPKKELLQVFDRGGYSKEFCIKISNHIRFICWRTDPSKAPKNLKWKSIEIFQQGNTIDDPKKLKMEAAERKVKFESGSKKATLRELWIKKGGKISPAITNDFKLPIAKVVQKLLNRWGAQENQFKELKSHGIDKIHSYRKEDYNKKMLYEKGLESPHRGVKKEIDNPQIILLRKQIAKHKLEKKIIEKKMKASETNARDGKSKRRIKYITKKIEEFKINIKKMPKKILLLKKIKEQNIYRLADRKKLFFDWLKIIAIWSKRQLVEEAKPFYKDLRDIKIFIESVLSSRAYVKKKNGILEFEFPEQPSKQKGEIIKKLCDIINGMPKNFRGMKFDNLIFRVRGVY